MKNKKVLIILAGLLVVLAGVYFAISILWVDEESGQQETTADTSVQLLELGPYDIKEIQVDNSYGEKTYVRDDSYTWRVQGDETADIAQTLINKMATNGGALTALAKIADTCDGIAKYGLDDPAISVTLVPYEGDSVSFYIGMQNQVTAEYYMYMEGVEGIFTLATNYPDFFDVDARSIYYFIDIDVTTDISFFDEIEFELGDSSWHLIKYEEGNEYDLSGMRAWYLVDLYDKPTAVDTGVLRNVLEPLLEVGLYSCEVFSASEETLEEFGLAEGNCKGCLYYYYTEEEIDEETYIETITTGEAKVWIGNKTEDGLFYYVRPDGRDGIYTMVASYIDGIMEISVEDMLQKYISLINIGTLSSYHVEYRDIDYKANVITEEKDDNVKYYHYNNGKEVENGSQLYTALVGIYAEKALLVREKPSGEPLLKITFERNTDVIPVYEVTFYEYSVNYYKVAIDGEISYLVNARDYKSLVETITSFVQNISYVE